MAPTLRCVRRWERITSSCLEWLYNKWKTSRDKGQYRGIFVGVGAQSTLGGPRYFCAKNMYEKLTKWPNFTRFLPEKLSKYPNLYDIWRKISKIPEFYMIDFARKMPEFYTIIARKKYFPDFFFGGGRRGGARAPRYPISYAYGRIFRGPLRLGRASFWG